MLNLHRAIDHTLLKPDASGQEIHDLVNQALRHRFASVCVNGRWISLVAQMLQSQSSPPDELVVPCAVVGFPLGAMRSSVKAVEAVAAVKDGAREVDMVIALDTLLALDLAAAREDVFEVVRAARAVRRDTRVKVILETAALNEEQTALGCQAAREGGADFVKTSTGFYSKGGATPETVGWLLKYAGGLKVKASGGIRDRATAEKYLEMGVARIGTSSGVAMLTQNGGGAAGY